MGGAQPLAATFAGFSMLAVECDESRIDMRLRTGRLLFHIKFKGEISFNLENTHLF